MYVVKITRNATRALRRELFLFALRTAKRKLDSAGGHQCLRQGETFACARCLRTAQLKETSEGYFVCGNLPEERCF